MLGLFPGVNFKGRCSKKFVTDWILDWNDKREDMTYLLNYCEILQKKFFVHQKLPFTFSLWARTYYIKQFACQWFRQQFNFTKLRRNHEKWLHSSVQLATGGPPLIRFWCHQYLVTKDINKIAVMGVLIFLYQPF